MGLLNKKILLITIVFISVSLSIYLLAYKLTNETIQKSFTNQIEINQNNINFTIKQFDKTKSDLLNTLTNNEDLKKFITTKNDTELKKLFLTFANSDKLIMQMRILNLNGNEIFRLDKVKDEYLFRNKKILQDKAHRDYFKSFLKLKRKELGISKLDLNVENNKVEKPFKSTIRMAMPIFLDKKEKAILIINYDMNSFIKNLFSSSTFNLYLIDQDKYFIYHPNDNFSWSRYKNNRTVVSDYFSKSRFEKLVFEDIDLWNNKYKIIYENKQTAGLNFFIEKTTDIAGLVFLGSILLVVPFFYMILAYIKKIKLLNSSILDSKVKIESILDHTSDAIILIDLRGIIQEINLSTEKIFGYKKDELINKNINILVPEPHHSKHDNYIRNHDKNMHSKVINIDRELFAVRKDGSSLSISLVVTKVNISNSEYFIGTIKNLSDEIKTKKLFENIFTSTAIGIAIVLKDGSLWRINKKFADIVEYTIDELNKLTFQDITHKDDLSKDLDLVNKVLNKEIDEYSIEKRYITKSGKIVWVNLRVKGVFSSENNEIFDYFIASVDNITEQIQIKNKLKEAEEIAHIGHWLWDIRKETVDFSDNMLAIFGKTKETFNNNYESFINIIHKDDKENILHIFNECLYMKKDLEIEYRIIVNNEIKFIYAKGRILYLGEEAIEFFGTCQDITKLKILEKETKKRELILMEQSKLASMGEMVGSIAHQWRQPLNSIGFILQDMISAYKHNEFNENYLKEVKKEMMEQLNYMSETIDEFRNYFKNNEPYKEFNIINTLLDVNKLYRAHIDKFYLHLKIKVNKKDVKDLNQEEINRFKIISQESQLKQVIINCISNAKDAIIELDDPIKEQKNIIVKIEENEKNIQIFINDLAGGVSSKTLSRVFEPYFTTKNMGTGLGLYICKTICTQSLKGDIEYKYNKEKINNRKYLGSSFIITLPKTI